MNRAAAVAGDATGAGSSIAAHGCAAGEAFAVRAVGVESVGVDLAGGAVVREKGPHGGVSDAAGESAGAVVQVDCSQSNPKGGQGPAKVAGEKDRRWWLADDTEVVPPFVTLEVWPRGEGGVSRFVTRGGSSCDGDETGGGDSGALASRIVEGGLRTTQSERSADSLLAEQPGGWPQGQQRSSLQLSCLWGAVRRAVALGVVLCVVVAVCRELPAWVFPEFFAANPDLPAGFGK